MISEAVNESLTWIDTDDLNIYACPHCRSKLQAIGYRLVCSRCGRSYEVRDNIPDFLLADPAKSAQPVLRKVRMIDWLAPIYETKLWYLNVLRLATGKGSMSLPELIAMVQGIIGLWPDMFWTLPAARERLAAALPILHEGCTAYAVSQPGEVLWLEGSGWPAVFLVHRERVCDSALQPVAGHASKQDNPGWRDRSNAVESFGYPGALHSRNRPLQLVHRCLSVSTRHSGGPATLTPAPPWASHT